MEQVSATKLAEHTGDVVNRAQYGGVPVVVTKRGKPAVVIVSAREWEQKHGKIQQSEE